MPPSVNLYELYSAIDDPSLYVDQLRALQGNILLGHGRQFANHIVIRFRPETGKATLRTAFQQMARSVTTAWDQEEEWAAARDDSARMGLPVFVGAGLSASGFQALGYGGVNLPTLTPERLGLPATDLREPAWQDPSAFVIVASNQETMLAAATADLCTGLEAVATYVVEPGGVFGDGRCQAIEHFGFADGISQPQFFTSRDGKRQESDLMSPRLALHRDLVSGGQHPDAGSFLAVLKIEQDIAAFRRETRALAARLECTPALAEAYIMGRFRDGTPVALQAHPGNVTNTFDYADDPNGNRCPLGAHIRKVAPRGLVANSSVTRITRRGMTYGERVPLETPEEELPSAGRGLLFQSVQQSIPEQFERVFREWANTTNFPDHHNGRDAMLGTGGEPNLWPAQWGETRTRRDLRSCSLRRFVRILGGGYFFLPSIPFLRNLPPATQI